MCDRQQDAAWGVCCFDGHDGPIQSVCFTADGTYCITGGYPNTIKLWKPVEDLLKDSVKDATKSTHRAALIQTFNDCFVYPVADIALDNESTVIVAASGKICGVTDVVSQKMVRRFSHNSTVNTVTLSQGRDVFVSGSYDGTVSFWDGRSRSNRPIQTLKDAKDSVTQIQIDQHAVGEFNFITGSVDGFVRIYDIRIGQIVCDDFGAPVVSLAQSADRDALAVSCLDGTIRLAGSGGKLMKTYENGHITENYAVGCAVTSDDACVVTGSEDGRVVVYDLASAKVLHELCLLREGKRPLKPTCAVACHPYRRGVLSGSYDGSAILWAQGDKLVE